MRAPQTLSEDTNIRGVTVPKDTMVMIQILPMQRHPKFWAEPLKFDPDRWYECQRCPGRRQQDRTDRPLTCDPRRRGR